MPTPHGVAQRPDGGAAHRPATQGSTRGVRLPPASRRPGSTAGPAESPNDSMDLFRQTHSKSADGSLPTDLWNMVVAKNTPQPQPWRDGDGSLRRSGSAGSSEQPFTHTLSRSYSSTLGKLTSPSPVNGFGGGMPDIPRSQTLAPLKKPGLPTVNEEEGSTFRIEDLPHSAQRPKATSVPSRADALLLLQTLQEMEASIQESLGGHQPEVLAMEAAQDADANRVMEILEPKIYSVDVVMSELVKQVGVACQERGQLLETCRTHFLAMMSISAAALSSLSTLCDQLHSECEALKQRLEPLEEEYKHAVEKIMAVELELKTSNEMVAMREAELEKIRQSQQKTQSLEELARGKRELRLQEKIDELNEINSLLKSKVAVIDNQLKSAERGNGNLQALVQEMQERVRRDADKIDYLGADIARYKINLAWFRCLAHLRRNKGEHTKVAATQDGPGLDHSVVGDGDSEDGKADDGSPGTGKGRGGGGGTKKKSFGGGGGQISFAAFWQGCIRQSQLFDLQRNISARLEKQKLLEKISMIYSEKIMVDELDDKLQIERQNMPEFCYDYHLELLYDPVLAEEAIVNLLANTRYYELDSARVRMFGRLLNMGGENISVDSINMFFLGLVKVQGGSSPLLPYYDNLYVDSAKAQRAAEHVFAQAPYIFRQKVVLECEKRSVGRQIDLDSFLFFMLEMWDDEQHRIEERMRSLFVGSDANADGNLDFEEFVAMIKHIKTNRPRRELLRMFSELTLHRGMDPNGFVRLCRKFKFMSFELGPTASKKGGDRDTKEIFSVLNSEWRKVEDVVHELLVVLNGTSAGERMDETVSLLKKLLDDKLEAEQTWLVYRKVVAEFTSAVKNRTPDPPPPEEELTDDPKKGKKGMKGTTFKKEK